MILWKIVIVAFVMIHAQIGQTMTLVDNGQPQAEIVINQTAAETEQFAAQEIQRYIVQISGARLPIVTTDTGNPAIYVGGSPWFSSATNADPWDDTFTLRVEPTRVITAGNTPRATLYAAYALLERLGCRWLAPNFSFYPGGVGEIVPRSKTLTLVEGDTQERPAWRYRAKYVEEGRTHTIANLLPLVDWMAKTRQNVFSCPTDYGGRGRVRWDAFREALTPEIKKRGMLIEVGGHGYQNFLPAERYFVMHPDWFGMDENGQRTRAANGVFATSNPAAMAEFTNNVLAYLRARPEINIFDLWPPDNARWSQAPEDKALGLPPMRHALVVNHVAKVLAKEMPHVTLEFIAYQDYLTPPSTITFAPNTIVGFCPIGRSFATSISDPHNTTNKGYWEALKAWQARPDTQARLYIYSYFRKYAWRSLPVLTPRLIAHDVAQYRVAGAMGISSYSEPGDWLTYEIQHLALAKSAWEPQFNADKFLETYCRERFGPAAAPMQRFFQRVEDTIPQAANIPGTPHPGKATLEKHLFILEEAARDIKTAAQLLEQDAERRVIVERLGVTLDYARLHIRHRITPEEAPTLRKELEALLKAHAEDGLFVSPTSILQHTFETRRTSMQRPTGTP